MSNLIKGSSPSSQFKPRVQVPQVRFSQGFESLKSIQVKGSSPSSQGFESLKSRVQVPPVKDSSPSLLYNCDNSSRVKREIWNPVFSWDITDDPATDTQM